MRPDPVVEAWADLLAFLGALAGGAAGFAYTAEDGLLLRLPVAVLAAVVGAWLGLLVVAGIVSRHGR